MARKILLADDSVTAQNMGRKILTDAGYEVITVNNGSAALKRIAEHKPDLIVLDVYMPGYSGLEVCQRIKENRDTARIPVLLTVGKLEPFKPEEARRARADAFVVKPFEASELLATLTRLEDKIVPQPEPYKPGRFAKAFAAVEQVDGGDKFGDAEGGWKDRLRFPSRKAKPPEDPAPELVTGKSLHDAAPSASQPPQAPPVGREQEFDRVMPAGIPHDITPEEIAALAAAAAKMSGAVAEVPVPPVVEEPPATVHEATVSPEQSAPPDQEIPDKAEAIVAGIAPTAFSLENPAEPSEPVTFAAGLSSISDITPTASAVEVATNSEPDVLQPVGDTVVPVPIQAVEAAGIGPDAPALESPVLRQEVEAAKAEQLPSLPDAGLPAEARSEHVLQAEAASEPVGTPATHSSTLATEAYFAAKPPVHSDADVMAALQALVPHDRHGPAAIAPDVLDRTLNPTPAFNLPVAAAELTRAEFAGGPRWIAEEIALTAEEATLSLENEMEKAYAAFAASDAARTLAVSDIPLVREPMRATQESTTDAAAAHTAQAFQEPVDRPLEAVSEPAAVEQAAFAMASAAAAGDIGSLTKPVAVQVPTAEPTTPVEEKEPQFNSPTSGAGASDSTAGAVAQLEAQPFADATLSPTTSDTEIVGGIDEMGKKDWADFRSIRGAAAAPKTAPVAPSDSPVIAPDDSAKSEPEAVAPANPPERALSATDPKAIASIVDSVLAELRPRIVEEIARKLSDPKKD